MAADPAVLAAFQNGSGLSGVTAHDAIVFALVGVTLLWLAWAVAGVGARVLDDRLTRNEGVWYAARAVVMAMLVVFALVR